MSSILVDKAKQIYLADKARKAAAANTWEGALTYVLANAKLVRGTYPEWGNIPKLTNRDAAGLIYALKDGEEYRLSKGVTAPWAPADWYKLALPALGWFRRGDKFDLSSKWQEHTYQPAFDSELIAFLIRLADQLDRAHVPVKILRDPRGTDALYRQLAMDAYRRMQKEDPESADVKPHKPAPGQGNKPTVKPPAVIVQPPAPSSAPPRAISTAAHDGDDQPMLVPDKAAPPPPPVVVATPSGPAIAHPTPPPPVVVPVEQPAEQARQAEAPPPYADDGGQDAPDDAPAPPQQPRQARPSRDDVNAYRTHHGLPRLPDEPGVDNADRSDAPSSAHDDDDDVRPARKKPKPEPSSGGDGAVIAIGLLLLAIASDD